MLRKEVTSQVLWRAVTINYLGNCAKSAIRT